MSQIEIKKSTDQFNLISCIAMDHYVVCGGYDGFVHVIQYQSKYSPNLATLEQDQNSKLLQYSKLLSYQAHKVMILGIDTCQNSIVSCALDGSIYCYQIDTNQIHQLQLNRPIKSVKFYGQSSSFLNRTSQPYFLYLYENKVVHYTSTLLNSNKSIVHITESEPIESLDVYNKIIITCSSNQIRIYEDKSLILSIEKQMACIPKIQCENNQLVIGWKNYLAVYNIQKDISLLLEITTSFFISGVGLLDNNVVVLGYPQSFEGQSPIKINRCFNFHENEENNISLQDNTEFKNEYPIIAIFNSTKNIFEESFALNIPDYKSIRPSEFQFSCKNNLFVISAPLLLLLGQPTTLEDQIELMLKDNLLEEAMQLIIKHSKSQSYTSVSGVKIYRYKFKVLEPLAKKVGLLLVDHYLELNCFEECAHILPSIIELPEYINYFDQFKEHLEYFMAILPLNTLLCPLYTQCFNELFIQKNYDLVELSITHIPIELINDEDLVSQLTDSKQHLKILSILYRKLNKHDLLVLVLLQLHCYVESFEIIANYPYLLPTILESHAVLYFELLLDIQIHSADYTHLRDKFIHYSASKITINKIGVELIFTECPHLIPSIVNQLNNTNHLCTFLILLFLKDSKLYTDYHPLLLRSLLKSDNQNLSLMQFLRQSSHYSLEEAVKLCEQHKYVNECLYLYGRMGNSKGAIKIILYDLKDYKFAIEYAEDQQDDEIWTILISSSSKLPVLWQHLLGSKVAVQRYGVVIVQKMDSTAKVTALKDKLLVIMTNNTIDDGLTNGCCSIMINDCLMQMKLFLKQSHSSGYIQGHGNGFIIFGCGHCYHMDPEHVEQREQDIPEKRERKRSTSSISSASTFRKFRKNVNQLKLLVEADKMKQINELQVECPICIKIK